MALLDVLRNNRKALLLGEVGALLHDLGKLNSRFCRGYMQTPPDHSYVHGDVLRLDGRTVGNGETVYTFLNETLPLDDSDPCPVHQLISRHHPARVTEPLPWTVRRADHLSANADRQWAGDAQVGAFLFRASVFGDEWPVDLDELDRQRAHLYAQLHQFDVAWQTNCDPGSLRDAVRSAVRETYQAADARADTQRPANDIALWEHADSTAAFFKALYAQQLLGEELTASEDDQGFTLCALVWDMAALFGQVGKIGDLWGRLAALTEINAALSRLIEVEYAAGSLVYGETGLQVFLLPQQFASSAGRAEFAGLVDDCLEPLRRATGLPLGWQCQLSEGPVVRIAEALPAMLAKCRLQPVADEQLQARCVAEAWHGAALGREACPVCRVRPGERPPNRPRSECLCRWCWDLRRRGQRRRQQEEGTVWVQRIADAETNRLAVLTVEIPLEQWIAPLGMLQLQQYLTTRDGETTIRSKQASYERLRRLWAATDAFLRRMLDLVRENLGAEAGWRFSVAGALPEGFYNVELPEQGAKVYSDGGGQCVTISRLRRPDAWATLNTLTLREERRGAPRLELEVTASEPDDYAPWALVAGPAPANQEGEAAPSIANEQTRLMIVLPARAARRIAERVAEAFDVEFSKALGKLPLAIGIVYAPVSMPLALSLQAALSMRDYLNKDANSPRRAEIAKVTSAEGRATLALDQANVPEGRIALSVDLTAGDNDTGALTACDAYYTRLPVEPATLAVQQPHCQATPVRFGSCGDEYIPVLAAQLKPGNGLSLLTGAFDFEFLDVAARRLQVRVTGAPGRRPHALFGRTHSPRPCDVRHLALFAQLDRLMTQFRRRSQPLTDTRLRDVRSLLETKFAEWRLAEVDRDHEAWASYRRLANAVLVKEFGASGDDLRFLQACVESGLFFDWAELFLQIEKRKLQEE